MSAAGSSTALAPGPAAPSSATAGTTDAGPSESSQAPANSEAPPTTTSSTSGPLSSPSFPTSASSRQAPSQLSPRTPTTASTSITTNPVLLPNLPSPSTPQQTAQARAALVGTISNLLDAELQSRASLLHSNARALEAQERDVVKATEALRKENEKFVKVVKEGSKKVLETGNVQNWAEVLERDFLVLEDTIRRVRRGSGGGCSDPDCSGCSSGTGSWSGSRTPSRRGSFDGEGEELLEDGDVGQGHDGKGKGKAVEDLVVSDRVGADAAGMMDIDERAVSGQGEREGSFAPVDNAIVASISEAMATSIGDFSEAPSIAEHELSLSEPASEHDEAHDKGNEVQVNSTGDNVTNSSSAMELDDQPKVPVEDIAALDDRDIKALEDIGLAPVARHGEQTSSQTGTETESDTAAHNDQKSVDHLHSNAAVLEDKMDIDTPEQAGESIPTAPEALGHIAGSPNIQGEKATASPPTAVWEASEMHKA